MSADSLFQSMMQLAETVRPHATAPLAACAGALLLGFAAACRSWR